MRLRALAALLLVGAGAAPPAPALAADLDPAGIYRERCASCHGERRYGGHAPPLIPETLAEKSDDALREAIRAGLPNTQMPAFPDLDPAQAGALVALLRAPLGAISWSAEDIAASRVAHPEDVAAIPAAVRREALILVVERGTGSISVLDGDSLEEVDRFPAGSVHGGLKFDLGLRTALAATRDGTLSAYDLARGGLRAQVKVGVNTRNIAISSDGGFVAAANQLPPGLVILDADLRPLRVLSLPGQPSAVVQLPGQSRFVVALRDVPRLLSVEVPGFAVREVALPEPFEDFVLVPGSARLVASSRGGSRLVLYDHAREAVVATLPAQGLPHLFSACFFTRRGTLHAAFHHVGTPRLSILDMDAFRVVKEIPLRGAGYFARTHPGTPWLWIDTNTEDIQLVDKESLELREQALTPEPGKKAIHVEFTADGSKALVSVWDPEGAVVAYDSKGLQELRRLPYAMPVGKYNTANKTRLQD